MSGNELKKFHPQKSWTRERTLDICKLFRDNPLLWDTAHEDYDNHKARECAMQNIRVELEPLMPGLNVNDIRKKLHNLRSQYRKQLLGHKMRLRKGFSGESMSWCLKELDFLEPFFLKESKISKYSNNLRHCDSEDVHRADFLYSVEDFQPVEHSEAKVPKKVSNADDELFMKRFAWLGEEVDNTFKEIQNEKLKKTSMMAIQKALKNARTRDQQNQIATTTTSSEDGNLNMPTDNIDIIEMTDEEDSELNDSLDTDDNVNTKSYFEWNYDMSIYNHEEIHVKLSQNHIIISACHEEHEVSGLGNIKRNFERILDLPNSFDHNIEATLSLDGVLTVRAEEHTLMDAVEGRNVIIQKV